MATYALIHGAGGDAWHWHLVVPKLEARVHDVVAVDLPCDDDAAGFDEYTDVVVDAIGDRRDVILVAQSLGGFTAPLVCDRLPVALMVLVAAMVARPGESAGEWWTNTGHQFLIRSPGGRLHPRSAAGVGCGIRAARSRAVRHAVREAVAA